MNNQLFSVTRINTRVIEVMRRLGDVAASCQALANDPTSGKAEYLAHMIADYSEASDAMLSSVQSLLRMLDGDESQK